MTTHRGELKLRTVTLKKRTPVEDPMQQINIYE